MSVDIRKLAREREALHRNHASSRPLSPDYEIIGLAGEQQFAVEFGLEVDTKARPGGDGGIDFQLPGVGSVDVKTACRPFNLLHEQGKTPPDIFVLARFDRDDSATLLGWEWAEVVIAQPVKDFGYGVINHYLSANRLRPIETLKAMALKG